MQLASNISSQLRCQWMFTSWQDDWLLSSTNVATVLAGLEVYLLSTLKRNSNFHGCDTKHALLMSTYTALLLFLSAALSGRILTNKFREFPVGVSHGPKRSSQVWLLWHCLISLIAGTISLIAQVLLYGWLEESALVRCTLSIIIAVTVLFLERLRRLLFQDHRTTASFR